MKSEDPDKHKRSQREAMRTRPRNLSRRKDTKETIIINRDAIRTLYILTL